MEKGYRLPSIEEFKIGFEFEMKENFMDGKVKTQEDYDSAKWVKEVVSDGDMPYIERTLLGRNNENGLFGIRVKIDLEK